MATTGTFTVLEIINAALEDVEAKGIGMAARAAQVDHARGHLYRMMKAWQNREGAPDFLRASQTVTATTSAAHTLNPVRPLSILNANVKQNGTEIPMLPLTRVEYDELPDKAATGIPTQFYYDRQKEAALFYVWPLFSTVSGETFEITYEREFEDVTDTASVIDVPGEWWDAVVLCLADRLLPAYGSEQAKISIPGRAKNALDEALAASVDESVFFGAEE